jgi:D-serine deaminase-like pyridoxal phosphate-dependent protein
MSEWYRIANEDDVPSPTVLIYPDRIAENIRRMIRGAGGPHRLRPHVKTHKLPQVVRMKLDAGITKFKAATIAEAEMTAEASGRDILLAYPLVGPNIRRLLRLMSRYPEVRFSTLVDDEQTVAKVGREATARGLTVNAFVDLNVGMDRTGIKPEPAAALYRQLAKTPGLSPAGLHAYDGHLSSTDVSKLRSDVATTFAPVWKLRDDLRREGLAVPSVVVSGTPTFPQFQNEDVEVGCGTTTLWDSGQAAISPDLEFLNAAILLTRVVSRPGTNRYCLDLGHKAVASEMPHPRAEFLGMEQPTAVRHSEEHLVVDTNGTELRVGDVLYAIPRHVCPTMALHQEVWVVRNGRAEETWPVVARARKMTV